MKKQTLFIVLIIGIALAIGVWRDNQNGSDVTQSAKEFAPKLPLTAGTAFPMPLNIPEFQLTDMNGATFDNGSLKSHWSFMFFGYTSCPNFCPTVLKNVHHLSQHLRAGPHVQYVFVTIDPKQDTTKKLKEYLQQEKYDQASFKGISGKPEEIQHLAQELGIHVAESQNISEAHIEHSGTLLLVNPDGKLAAIFTNCEKTHAIAHDFKDIAHQYSRNT